MQQTTLLRNTPWVSALGLAAAGGWLAFNSFILNGYGETQLTMAGAGLLIAAWRLGAISRVAAWSILFAWYMAAGSFLPSTWGVFFPGNEWGWAALALWAAVVSSPTLLLPARFSPLSLALAAAVAALTPIGTLNPVLAMSSFFPGLGWIGLALALYALTLPHIKNEKTFAVLAVVTALTGAAQNAVYDTKPARPPEKAWGLTTYEGDHPKLVRDWFARQARLTAQVRAGIRDGATLIVTPEATVDVWDGWAGLAWREAIADAKHHPEGMVLIGVFRKTPGTVKDWENGLLDLGTGELHKATVSMPISMWKPWGSEHYPVDLNQLPRTIKTPVGEAAYLLCYEETLLWPLAAKVAVGRPTFILSAVNQWFAKPAVGEAQKRSIWLQSRLWGLPLLRAVSWSR